MKYIYAGGNHDAKLKKEQTMQHRRRSKQEITNQTTLQPAFKELKNLRTRMIKHMVTVDFTVNDVIAWLWPKETLYLLEAAYPYVQESWNDTAQVRLRDIDVDVHVTLTNMLIPKNNAAKIQNTDAVPRIMETINQFKLICMDFKDVERVIDWLQTNASLSATRYYWPSVLSLLPANHDIHTCSSRYKEPIGVHEMIPAFHSTSTLIASTLLCPKLSENDTPSKVNLLINGELVPLL